MTITVTNEKFALRRGLKTKSATWKDVRRIEGTLLDKVTYEESFLILTTLSGAVDVGEMDKNFDAFEKVLLDQFPDFPLDWKNRVEAAGHNSRITLWPRS